MPFVFALTCASCGEEADRMTTGHAVVDLDDGTEAGLSHPVEESEARERTGLELADLVRAGRVGYRHALTCRACGRSGYHRSSRSFREGAGSGLVQGITHLPTPEEAAEHSCERCGARRMIAAALVDPDDPDRRAPCPRCGGPLRRETVGIS